MHRNALIGVMRRRVSVFAEWESNHTGIQPHPWDGSVSQTLGISLSTRIELTTRNPVFLSLKSLLVIS
jgi:hypothetical protein